MRVSPAILVFHWCVAHVLELAMMILLEWVSRILIGAFLLLCAISTNPNLCSPTSVTTLGATSQVVDDKDLPSTSRVVSNYNENAIHLLILKAVPSRKTLILSRDSSEMAIDNINSYLADKMPELSLSQVSELKLSTDQRRAILSFKLLAPAENFGSLLNMEL
uniref:Uncharacterized protein n=1 Tax=Glossina austeni TaxID=7395 RepID=A0A1A9VD95_GLOAU